ncbi:MAG: ABC transporter ATP-binding protein [Cellulosilyticum sp.]|nr:ABC transporter ATP-binding protein [Cellulosilyticum sp.]
MSSTNTLFRLIKEVQGKRAWIYFGCIIAMAIFEGTFGVLGSLVIKELFALAEQGTLEGLLGLLVRTLVIGTVIVVLSICATVGYNDEAKRAETKVNKMIFMKAMRLPMSYYENHHTGDFMSRLTHDSMLVGGIFGSRLRRTLMPILMTIVCIIPMFCLSFQVTIGLLGLNIVLLSINMLMVRPMKKVGKQEALASKDLTTKITNILQGIETLKIFSAKETIIREYDEANKQYSKVQKKSGCYGAILSAFNTAFNFLGLLLFLALGIYYIEKGIVTLGDLAAIYTIYGQFSWSFLQIGRYIPNLAHCIATAERMYEFWDLEEEPVAYLMGEALERESIKTNEQKSKIQNPPMVSFENITFGYEEGKQKILEDFNLSVEKGTSVAITGESGRGKSTLAKLLLGFYPIEKGNIYIDGQSVSELGLEKIRDLIAYVPQEPYLYDVSILENIGYGKKGATFDEIVVAAKAANAHEFILKQPNGYDTVVGERGSKLSGGEKQRIAIARAILKNAPILLLDEATSALDNESEYLVQEAIGKLMKDRTTLMIAHRPSTIATADVKVVM